MHHQLVRSEFKPLFFGCERNESDHVQRVEPLRQTLLNPKSLRQALQQAEHSGQTITLDIKKFDKLYVTKNIGLCRVKFFVTKIR